MRSRPPGVADGKQEREGRRTSCHLGDCRSHRRLLAFVHMHLDLGGPQRDETLPDIRLPALFSFTCSSTYSICLDCFYVSYSVLVFVVLGCPSFSVITGTKQQCLFGSYNPVIQNIHRPCWSCLKHQLFSFCITVQKEGRIYT